MLRRTRKQVNVHRHQEDAAATCDHDNAPAASTTNNVAGITTTATICSRQKEVFVLVVLRFLTVLLLVLVCFYYYYYHDDHSSSSTILTSSTTSSMSSTSMTNSSRGRKTRTASTSATAATIICPHARQFYAANETALKELEIAMQRANTFHQRGGSFKSVQKFLNRQIPSTLERLGITYDEKNAKHPTNFVLPLQQQQQQRQRQDEQQQQQQQKQPVPVDEYLQKYFQTHKVRRGGYGQPLPIQFKEKFPAFSSSSSITTTTATTTSSTTSTSSSLVDTALHGGRWIDVMEEATSQRFKEALGPMGPFCPHMMSFSENKGLQEKTFCVEEQDGNTRTTTMLRNSNGNGNGNGNYGKTEECHIFSIGSNDQWGFETSVRERLPHCHTHTFDCTLKGSTPVKKPLDSLVQFYPYCISGEAVDDNQRDNSNQEHGRKEGLVHDTATVPMTTSISGNRRPRGKYLPYMDLWKMTSIQHPPKLLKMDVEGFEFDVLISMLNDENVTLVDNGSYLPEQIMMEVHWATRMVDIDWMLRTRQTAELALFFDTLWNAGGYLPIKVQYFDQWCASCMEILLLRVRC